MKRHPNRLIYLPILLIGLSACATVSEPDYTNGRTSLSQAVFTDLHFDCDGVSILLTDAETNPTLVAGGESIPMQHSRAASGVRFEARSEATTILHMKGESAWVSLHGQDHTGCKLAVPPAAPFTAQGQEPPWRLQVMEEHLTLTTGYAGEAQTMALSQVEQSGLVTRIQARGRTDLITLDILRGICHDSMSGMPHPYSVTLSGIEGVQPGCGGRPIDLLTGQEWIIVSLDGVPPIEGLPVTLSFLAEDDRIAGAGSCNRYHAGYTLDGESLRFTHAATTMMACTPELMEQERRFHEILSGIERFDFDLEGQLILAGAHGQLVATDSPLQD